ncbi:tripartite tricarboxylate transporter substrate binding protein [Roseomonas stagni]|uniref:Tripartite tricarboxylate transporter substrate binding protein n=1 Tax=Falsiroseomonas algicola TaxID=2716930 RepID=A0A6M1LJI0_9PROT|nr:tripartite tricarboxylate transporter substrate-binding protein [Falsiroseomonas algicola]NGM20044.1 tripartite tricarboxylate transporter substrate binding protein [Falsiroseomonas algicola]
MMDRRTLMAAAALAALPGIARAQPAWPSRAVRMVVPFPPGGSNDVLGRALCERLGAQLSQPFVVENRGGAGGAIGADQVAKSAPDGYTLLFMSSSLTTNAAVQRLPYDPVADFTPIAQAAVAPMIVTVGKDSPARTMADLVRIARERPGMLRFGGAGPGDTSFFATELLKMAANLDMEAVAYRGITEAQTDAAAGRIDLVVTTLASARGLIEAGQLRLLATASAERDPRMADVPTVREATGIDYVTGVWWGVFAPARMPPALTAAINAAVNRAMAEPQYQRVLEAGGASMAALAPEAFAARVRSEVARWTDVAKRAGVALN